MKKAIILLISIGLVCISCVTKAPLQNDNRYIVSIYAKENAQPYDNDMLDTIWIYYSDGSFEQYAELDDAIELFSTGTYVLAEDDDFYIEEADEPLYITITRDQKFQNGKLSEYSSEHLYNLGTLGFDQLYGYNKNDGRIAEALFYGLDKQLYIDEMGDKDMLDTCWIYYNDNTFEQYAELDDEIVLFSTGTYKLVDGGDFIYEMNESDFGDIIINRDQKYKAGEGLVAYASSHRYDLNSLGFDEIALSTY